MAFALNSRTLAALLAACHVLTTASSVDTEQLAFHLFPEPTQLVAKKPTSKEMLLQEAATLQKKIDLVDQAMSNYAGHSDVLQQGRLALVEAKAHAPLSMLQSSGAAPKADVRSNRTGIMGMWDDLAEWTHDNGTYTPPRRNKVVLAMIELVPPLAICGMDRLYLGQPVMAAAKLTTFFATCGFVGGIWAILDTFFVTRNCLDESRELDEFGMSALFVGSEAEIKLAGDLAYLVPVSWLVHIIWAAYLVKNWMARRAEAQAAAAVERDPEIPEGTIVDVKHDAFMTEVSNFQDKAYQNGVKPWMRQDEQADYAMA